MADRVLFKAAMRPKPHKRREAGGFEGRLKCPTISTVRHTLRDVTTLPFRSCAIHSRISMTNPTLVLQGGLSRTPLTRDLTPSYLPVAAFSPVVRARTTKIHRRRLDPFAGRFPKHPHLNDAGLVTRTHWSNRSALQQNPAASSSS